MRSPRVDDHVINCPSQPQWSRAVSEITDGVGVHHIVEIGGSQTLARSLRPARPRMPMAGAIRECIRPRRGTNGTSALRRTLVSRPTPSVHSVSTTPANEPDVDEVALLLHGKEQCAHGDAGYAGADTRVVRKGLQWQIAAKRGRIKAARRGGAKGAGTAGAPQGQYPSARKASVSGHQAPVGVAKVRFRGLTKNKAHIMTLFALSNLYGWPHRRLMAIAGVVRP